MLVLLIADGLDLACQFLYFFFGNVVCLDCIIQLSLNFVLFKLHIF
jgi:hypothetical protein